MTLSGLVPTAISTSFQVATLPPLMLRISSSGLRSAFAAGEPGSMYPMTGFWSWYSGAGTPTPLITATRTTARRMFMIEPMAMTRSRAPRLFDIMSSGASSRPVSNIPSPRSLT